MKTTFKDCLTRKRIFLFPAAKHLVGIEIEDAESDLQSAQEEYFLKKEPLQILKVLKD